MRFIGGAEFREAKAAVQALRDAGHPTVVIARMGLSSRLEGIQGLAPQKTAGGYTLFVSRGETSGDAGRHKAEETTDN